MNTKIMDNATRDNAANVAKWLNDLHDTHNAKPVQVDIMSPNGKNQITCCGASFRQCDRDDYRLYLLINVNDLKSVYSRKHYYSINGEDWYIAAYADDRAVESRPEYHPLGHNVIMVKWDSDMPLDSNDNTGQIMPSGYYPRCQMVVTQLA